MVFKRIDWIFWKEGNKSELKEVFRDGKLLVDVTLSEIRENIKK